MLKKLFYIGLGMTIIAAKKSMTFFSHRMVSNPAATSEVITQAAGSGEVAGKSPAKDKTQWLNVAAETQDVSDNLTAIKGIGPTYAKRLRDAGITTYASLARHSADDLRLITNARGQNADTNSWIKQASEFAS